MHYYKFNKVMSNVFIITEIIYCLICMVIFLLIIYWNHEQRKDIVIGKDDQYSSEEDVDELSHEEYLEEIRLQKIKQMEINRLDRHVSILDPELGEIGLIRD